MKAVTMHSYPYLNNREWNKICASKVNPGIPPLGSKVFNCGCPSCRNILRDTAHWTELKKDTHFCVQSNVRVGDRVIVQGKYPGVVRYIGDLDSSFVNDEFYVGVKLDDPIGENDGLYNGKRFFKCPPKHGLVVPLNQVALIPVPGKKYERRVTGYASSPVISKKCCDQKLMKQAEKLLPPSTMSSIMTPSPLIVKRSSADIYLSDHSIVSKKSAAGVLSKNQSFRSTDVEVSSVSKMSDTPLPIQEISDQRSLDIPVTKGEKKISLASESSTVTEEAAAMEEEHVALPEEESPGSEKQPSSLFPTILKKPTSALSQNDDLTVSAWLDRIQAIRNSPHSAKLYVNTPLAKDSNLNGQDDETEFEENFQARTLVKPKTSFTARLLSGLPKADMATPVSPDTKLKDVEDFSYWMNQWGGGVRGWTMASTLQKLKDARRLGAKQIQWQQTIDELEAEEEFSQQVKRIQALHKDLLKVRCAREEIEKKSQTDNFMRPPVEATVFHYQMEIEKELRKVEELEASVKENSLSSMIDISKLMMEMM